uniref:Putative lipocalin-2 1 n=1 Tax=Amblyomma triste TaxID=251400 RepID=A0A023GDK9_AMBTT
MIFSLTLSLCVAAAAVADSGVEDLGWQFKDIRDMVKVKEVLMVDKRTHTTKTHFRCHSALQVQDLGDMRYNYTLKARNGDTESSPYVSGYVSVQLKPLEKEPGVYMATYTNAAQTTFELWLMEKDEHNTCFLLYVHKSDGRQGCELLLKASALEKEIPEVCQSAFDKSCFGERVQLREANCKYN